MKKETELVPVAIEQLPNTLTQGLLYISDKFRLSSHLCACGCGNETVLPFSRWTHTKNENGEYTIRPSIGNWKGQNPYHAHYYITNNKIEWL